jgi:hypothetical protein
MKKFAAVLFLMFVWMFAQPASAQQSGPATLEKQIYKRDQAIVSHDAQLETVTGTVKALMEFCAKAGSREELLKKLEKRRQFEKVKRTSKKTTAQKTAEPPKATPLPEPPKSCDHAELEKYLKQVQVAVADHEVRIRVLEGAKDDLVKLFEQRLEQRFRLLLVELGKKFPKLKPAIIKVEQSIGDLDALKKHFDELLTRMDDLEQEMAGLHKDFLSFMDNVNAMLVQMKNKQSALRFQLSGMAAGHYDGDITRFFGMLSAELVIPMHRIFALSAGGALGKGPRGLGTMFRAGGELGGIVRFRFAGVGVWDFRHSGTITRWIGGTIGLGVNIPLYQDQPHYKRPPVELALFLDAGLGWLAQYCKDSVSPLGMAGIGIRF